MPRGRRNNYNYYYPQRSLAVGKRNKYQSMTFYATNPSRPNDPAYKWYFTIVNPTDVTGMRKVKNISIQLAYDASFNTGTSDEPVIDYVRDQKIFWAIVYVPKGSLPDSLHNTNGGIFYSPPQFVMASGVYDCDQPGNSSRIFTPLSRNLNAGDGIAFVFNATKELYAYQLSAVINYAITFQ